MKKIFISLKHFKTIVTFVVSMILCSCKKFVSIEPPKDKLTLTKVFSGDEAANAAMSGLYSEIVNSFNNIGNGALSLFPCLTADELVRTSSSSIYDPFTTNSLLPSDGRITAALWQRGYFHIYQANAIIENLSKTQNVNVPIKNQLLGEAKFLRAFFHFYLTNLFGDIPIITSTDFEKNSVLVRSDTSTVYNLVQNDLLDAQKLLSADYPTGEKVRVNYWTATALLARVFLYRRNWAAAESEASRVIESGLYGLTSLDSVFVPNNSEAIFQFMPPLSSGINTAEGFNFIPTSPTTKPTFILTPFLLNDFEAGDERKLRWVKTVNIGGTTFSYPYKYKVKTESPGAPRSEYYIVLRLAEQYLIRAEARTRLNDLAGALSDLNLIRIRAGLPEVVSTDPTNLLKLIEKEREAEFFVEWGHRWFDLKRTNAVDTVLRLRKTPNWQITDQLYPIPQSEINADPLLTQNPGY